MTRFLARGAAAGALVLGGCASYAPPVPLELFVNGDLESVRSFFDEQVREGDVENGALFLNGLAQVDLYEGDYETARRRFETAGRVMGNWATSGGEAAGAVIGSESSKTWKGDPHEKAMNAFYAGVLYWMRGEADNARAAFRRGILADGESDEGHWQVDFSLLYWLAGRASLEMGLPGDAEGLFEEARVARAFAVEHGARGASSAPILTDPARGNLIVLAELGLGPRKVAAGPHGALAAIQPRPVMVSDAEVFVDGASVGRTTLLADLDYQALTRGGAAMEGIREGKAVFKDVTGVSGMLLLAEGLEDHGAGQRDKLIVGGALLLASLFTSAEADTRHWETLPQMVHALTAEVLPGRHEVRIEFFRPGGAREPAMTQIRTIDVEDRRDAILLFRSMPGPRSRPVSAPIHETIP